MTVSPPCPDLPAATTSAPAAGRPDPGRGTVEAIHIAPAAGAPMLARERVRAIAGVGLEGDRYATGSGHYSGDPKVDRHVTLIEAEEIEAFAGRSALALAGGETRRNVTTRGIRLNDLVGRRFWIGAVECEGTRLCEPCQYLTDLIDKPMVPEMVHRAGLRARILTDGEIGLGDEVLVLD